MRRPSRFAALTASLLLVAACAGAVAVSTPWAPSPAADGWSAAEASTRRVGLGLSGGARLAEGVTFMGGVELKAPAGSPLHSLSDLKLTGGTGFVTVSDVGDLVRGELRLDDRGRLVGLDALRHRRLTRLDGTPITEKFEGDAEGLAFVGGALLVSFERDHRIWSYGPLDALSERPVVMRKPDFPFTENDGIEGLATAPGGWRVAGESGGVWDCSPAACAVVTPPPAIPVPDTDYRITGMDRDPAGDGWFVVERSYKPPLDVRARVRRMALDGSMGPNLIELTLPGTTDNFEGIAAVTRNGRTRLYILSDDNFNPMQRTLMLAFDIGS